MIGLGNDSPIWLGNYDSGFVGLKFSNLTDWTWASFVPTETYVNNLTLWNETVTYDAASVNEEFFYNVHNFTQQSEIAKLGWFTFGINYTTESGYYANLTDNGTYPVYSFNSLASGLILSPNLYKNFVEHLYIATNGTVECNNIEESICYLPNSCSAYADNLFALYAFKFAEGVQNNITVPLATFAVDRTDSCEIWVQY